MRDFGSFHSGDAVQLNSGGPVMIVDRVNVRAGRVMRCQWYEGLTLHQEVFCMDDVHRCFGVTPAASSSRESLRELHEKLR
jgi:uncharacterized protein YodC (DUF2158 family)